MESDETQPFKDIHGMLYNSDVSQHDLSEVCLVFFFL